MLHNTAARWSPVTERVSQACPVPSPKRENAGTGAQRVHGMEGSGNKMTNGWSYQAVTIER